MADVRSREASTTNQQFGVQVSPRIGNSMVDTRAYNSGRSSRLMYTTPIVTHDTSKERSGMSNNYSEVTGFAKLEHLRFNGDKIKEWLFQIEQFFLIDHTPEELKVSFASIHFDDLAATWHQWILQSVLWKHVRHDWVTYKMLLQGRFKELEVDPIVELKQLQETDGIEDFHKKFELLKSQVNLSEADLVSVYLAGLRFDTQMNVRMFRPQTIRHCFMLGRLYETAHPTSVIISTRSDDYQKGVQPLNVSSKTTGTSMSNDGICMIDNDEDRFLSGSDLVENEVEEVKKDLVEIDGVMSSDDDQISDVVEVLGFNVEECEIASWIEQNQLIQEQAEIHSTDIECVSRLQQVSSTFEDFDKADATMNHLLPPIGFVVADSQSGYRRDIESKDIQQFQIVIEEGNNSYDYQESNGMRLRSHILTQQTKPSKSPKSWKFKFKISKDSKLRFIKFWWEEASSKKKLKCVKFWKFHYKNKSICKMKLFTYKKRQKKWPFMGKAEVDKESVEMLRGCTSGQTIGAYGSEIKSWDINNRVWDPGGSIFMNFSFKLKLWIWLGGQIWKDEATWFMKTEVTMKFQFWLSDQIWMKLRLLGEFCMMCCSNIFLFNHVGMVVWRGRI